MAYVQDSSQAINITVISQGHAIFSVGPTVNPTSVAQGGQATINYTIQNTGGTDTLWGGLYDAGGTLVAGTFWGPVSVANNATYSPPQIVLTNLQTSIVNWQLRVGHEE